MSEGRVLFEVFEKLARTSCACSIQISRETIQKLRINNIHKNVRDNCSLNLYVTQGTGGQSFRALLYHIIQS
jgi:hypothetical protein